MEEFISRVAQSDSTVLIRGESGTGKEVVARSIHQSSPRQRTPLHRHQLRRNPGDAAGKRTLRTRKGRIHRRRRHEEGQARGRRGRNPVPRRDRRTRAANAGQAPASPPAKRVRAGWRNPPGPLQSSRPRRNQQKPGTGNQVRRVSPGPLLPAQRRLHHRARRCASTARIFLCSPCTSPRSTRKKQAAVQRHLRRRRAPC